MKCPFCDNSDEIEELEEMLVHLTVNHQEKIPFPLFVKINEDGSKELLEEVSSATGLGADLQPLMDRCRKISKTYSFPCLEPKGHEGAHKHFPWEWLDHHPIGED